MMRKILPHIIALLLAAFGLLTLFLSSSVIFDLFDTRAKEGNYVLFVVWANFLSSILYLVAAFGLIRGKKWTIKPLSMTVIILFLAFIGLIIHINSGGIYETQTIGALIFRLIVTTVFAALAYFLIYKKNK